jgi:hypothetical protein
MNQRNNDSSLVFMNSMPENSPQFELGILLVNSGPGIARELYVNASFQVAGSYTEYLVGSGSPMWNHHSAPAGEHFISDAGFRLAPRASVLAARFTFALVPPFESNFVYEISYGAVETPTSELRGQSTVVELRTAYEEVVHSARTQREFSRFARRVLGLEPVNPED